MISLLDDRRSWNVWVARFGVCFKTYANLLRCWSDEDPTIWSETSSVVTNDFCVLGSSRRHCDEDWQKPPIRPPYPRQWVRLKRAIVSRNIPSRKNLPLWGLRKMTRSFSRITVELTSEGFFVFSFRRGRSTVFLIVSQLVGELHRSFAHGVVSETK